MTFDEADAKIKDICGPFAHAIDRTDKETYGWDWSSDSGMRRFYVG